MELGVRVDAVVGLVLFFWWWWWLKGPGMYQTFADRENRGRVSGKKMAD